MDKVLKMSNICKSYGSKEVVKDLSLEVARGEIVGMVGPNGAGKTTTMRMILDLARPKSGDIRINGKNLYTEREEALKAVSGIIETPALYTYLSGKQHLKMAASLRGSSIADLDEMEAFSGLGRRLSEPVERYSLGMKQRLALAMCLLVKPKLLVLDEPVNGMDPEGIITLRTKMKDLALEGTGILISSHILDELQKTADRFLFLRGGKLRADVTNTGKDDMEALYLNVLRGNAYENTDLD